MSTTMKNRYEEKERKERREGGAGAKETELGKGKKIRGLRRG